MSQSLTAKTINGVKWTTIATVSNSVMQIGYTAVMARLLEPSAFGLIAMAGVIMRFGGYFATMGMGQAIVQKKELTTEDIRAAFTSAIILGSLIFVLTWFLAPFSVLMFDNKDVVEVVRFMSIGFVIGGFSSTASSILRRRMEFKTLSILETVSYIVAYMIVGVGFAYFGFGVWSLVIAGLSQSIIVSVASYLVVRHNIQLLFSWEHYKPLFSYGSKSSFISFLEFMNGNMDTLLIGHFLGSSKLGIYNRAYNLLYLPLYFLTNSLSKVIFPSFSQLQSEKEKLAKIYLSCITLVASVVIPASIGIMVASKEIVLILLGDKWTESIPILQIICIAIPLSMITMFAGIVCDATANLTYKIVLNILFITLICTLFFLLKDFGLVGFAATIALGEVCRTFMYMYVTKRVLNINYGRILIVYVPGLINGLFIGIAIYLVSSSLRAIEAPVVITLVCQIITGALLLLLFMFLLPHPLLRGEIHTFLSKINLSKSKYYDKIFLPYLNYLNRKA